MVALTARHLVHLKSHQKQLVSINTFTNLPSKGLFDLPDFNQDLYPLGDNFERKNVRDGSTVIYKDSPISPQIVSPRSYLPSHSMLSSLDSTSLNDKTRYTANSVDIKDEIASRAPSFTGFESRENKRQSKLNNKLSQHFFNTTYSSIVNPSVHDKVSLDGSTTSREVDYQLALSNFNNCQLENTLFNVHSMGYDVDMFRQGSSGNKYSNLPNVFWDKLGAWKNNVNLDYLSNHSFKIDASNLNYFSSANNNNFHNTFFNSNLTSPFANLPPMNVPESQTQPSLQKSIFAQSEQIKNSTNNSFGQTSAHKTPFPPSSANNLNSLPPELPENNTNAFIVPIYSAKSSLADQYDTYYESLYPPTDFTQNDPQLTNQTIDPTTGNSVSPPPFGLRNSTKKTEPPLLITQNPYFATYGDLLAYSCNTHNSPTTAINNGSNANKYNPKKSIERILILIKPFVKKC